MALVYTRRGLKDILNCPNWACMPGIMLKSLEIWLILSMCIPTRQAAGKQRYSASQITSSFLGRLILCISIMFVCVIECLYGYRWHTMRQDAYENDTIWVAFIMLHSSLFGCPRLFHSECSRVEGVCDGASVIIMQQNWHRKQVLWRLVHRLSPRLCWRFRVLWISTILTPKFA